MARRLIVLLAAGLVVLAACTPVKPRPVPGRSIAYYYVQDLDLPDPTDAFRSSTPFSQPVNGGLGTARQTLNAEGQVLLEVINACVCGAFSGFYTPLIPLGSLNEVIVRLVPGGSDAGVSIIFDISGNGEWSEWDASGQRTSFGGDDQGMAALTQGGQLTIGDNRELFLVEAGVDWTIAELKAGMQPGIDANTPVGILIEAVPGFLGTDATSIVAQVLVNGIQILP